MIMGSRQTKRALSLPSTSSDDHDRRALFCAISRPDTATPPALAAYPNYKLHIQNQCRAAAYPTQLCLTDNMTIRPASRLTQYGGLGFGSGFSHPDPLRARAGRRELATSRS